MTDDNEEREAAREEYEDNLAEWPPVFIHARTLPNGTAQEAPEVLQRTAMALEQLRSLLGVVYAIVDSNAPIIWDVTIAGPMMTTVGYALGELIAQHKACMARLGIEPLDVLAEQLRNAREVLADPSTDEELKSGLEKVIARLEKATEEGQATEEWPGVISDREH